MIKANSGLGEWVLTVVLVVLFFTAFTAVASAETFTVCSSGCGYTTIHEAVGAASSGDTVFVYNGSYTDNIVISNASLTVQGEGADVVTVTAESSSDSVFHINNHNINVSGFNVSGATGTGRSGIYVSQKNNFNISNNRFVAK